MDTVVTEPTKKAESTVEAYCPTRFHEASKAVFEQGGEQYAETSESFWIEGTSYAKKGPKWVISQEERVRATAYSTRGATEYGRAARTDGPDLGDRQGSQGRQEDGERGALPGLDCQCERTRGVAR
jgi:hypothetical protein